MCARVVQYNKWNNKRAGENERKQHSSVIDGIQVIIVSILNASTVGLVTTEEFHSVVIRFQEVLTMAVAIMTKKLETLNNTNNNETTIQQQYNNNTTTIQQQYNNNTTTATCTTWCTKLNAGLFRQRIQARLTL